MSVYAGEEFTIEQNGRTYRVEIEFDDSHGAPWEEVDGNIPVDRVYHDYGTRYGSGKGPGDFVFHRGDSREWSYCVNIPDALAIARRDQWGIGEEETARFVAKHGRQPTKRETALIAVNSNIEFCRAWCADEWSYVGIIVTLLDDNGDETDESESLWGVESCEDYARKEVVPELIACIESRIQDAAEESARESAEVAYWASRDVVTKGV